MPGMCYKPRPFQETTQKRRILCGGDVGRRQAPASQSSDTGDSFLRILISSYSTRCTLRSITWVTNLTRLHRSDFRQECLERSMLFMKGRHTISSRVWEAAWRMKRKNPQNTKERSDPARFNVDSLSDHSHTTVTHPVTIHINVILYKTIKIKKFLLQDTCRIKSITPLAEEILVFVQRARRLRWASIRCVHPRDLTAEKYTSTHRQVDKSNEKQRVHLKLSRKKQQNKPIPLITLWWTTDLVNRPRLTWKH